MSKRSPQLGLALPQRFTHGGARQGAGRKPSGARPRLAHAARPELSRHHPIHVTLRVRPEVWNLRSRRSFRRVEHALRGVQARPDFRVVHFSVEGNHLHAIVEADDRAALTRGVKALSARFAIGLNRLMGRTGPVFADRYHARVLETPREVRNAVAYVVCNHASHMRRIGASVGHGAVDPFSSQASNVASKPVTWLLRSVAARAAG